MAWFFFVLVGITAVLGCPYLSSLNGRPVPEGVQNPHGRRLLRQGSMSEVPCAGADLLLLSTMTETNALTIMPQMEGGLTGKCGSCIMKNRAGGPSDISAACTSQEIAASVPIVDPDTKAIHWRESVFSIFTGSDGWRVTFDCPSDKWCGIAVCKDLKVNAFSGSDAYILARHGMCDEACCNALDKNPKMYGGAKVGKHDCPLSECCSNVDITTGLKAPVGLRILHEVMHLRGEATFLPVGDAAEDDFHPSIADPGTGRHTVSAVIPFNNPKPNFLTLDPTQFRSIVFVQAGKDADTFGPKPGVGRP